MIFAIRTWSVVCAWALACAALGPVSVVGFVLAWLHRAAASVLRWCFWEPTRAVWSRLVGAYRVAAAEASPAVADEMERQRKLRTVLKRARRARGGR